MKYINLINVLKLFFLVLVLLTCNNEMYEPFIFMSTSWNLIIGLLIVAFVFAAVGFTCTLDYYDNNSKRKSAIESFIKNKILSSTKPSVYYNVCYAVLIEFLLLNYELYISTLFVLIGLIFHIITISHYRKWYDLFNATELKMLELSSKGLNHE